MKLKNIFIALLGTVFLAISCKKEPAAKYCWQLIDALGNNVDSVCGKTLSEMQSLHPNSCDYYQIGGNKYCWFVDQTYFIQDATENSLNHYLQCFGGVHAIKVGCDYCQKWYSRQKNIYKPTNAILFSAVHLQQYCGDTVHTLFQGREIIIRETADSLIVLQFSNNGIF